MCALFTPLNPVILLRGVKPEYRDEEIYDNHYPKGLSADMRKRFMANIAAEKRRGARVEFEHIEPGDDSQAAWNTAFAIASHHLYEHPHYYRELAKMEAHLGRNPIKRRRI